MVQGTALNSVSTPKIVDKSDNRYHANSIYTSKETEEYLEANECEGFIHEKGYRGNPLTDLQKESNNKKSKIRARVEHVFYIHNKFNE
jgi:IS5 family transposase